MYAQLEQVLHRVSADGRASERTGGTFTCRIWVKNAIAALQDNNIIMLRKSVGMCSSSSHEAKCCYWRIDKGDIETEALRAAIPAEKDIEQGRGAAVIMAIDALA